MNNNDNDYNDNDNNDNDNKAQLPRRESNEEKLARLLAERPRSNPIIVDNQQFEG